MTIDRGGLTGVIGGYYSHLSNKKDRAASVFFLDPVADLGLPSAISAFYPAKLQIDTNQFYPQTVTTAAAFGDASWEIVPRLKLLGGFRYDYEKQIRANENSVVLTTPLPDPANFGAFGPTIAYINSLIDAQLAAANSSSPAGRTVYKAFLPKAGASYEFSDDANVSATVQRGYRSGGSGVNPGRGRLYTYKPEYTWNYELALRSQWLDRKLTLNANAFYIDWKDQQVNVQLSGNVYDYETRNAGSSRVYGFEVESNVRASRALELYASVGYANTRFKDFTVAGASVADLSGRDFSNAPRWTMAAGGTWHGPHGLFTNLNVNRRTAAYQAVLEDRRALRARTIVNAKIGWENENFGAYVTVDNLFDTHYFDYQYYNGARRQASLGQPRLLGIQLETKF